VEEKGGGQPRWNQNPYQEPFFSHRAASACPKIKNPTDGALTTLGQKKTARKDEKTDAVRSSKKDQQKGLNKEGQT